MVVVHNDFHDSKRRQCNVVVSLVASVDGVSDVDPFICICENNLTVKPFVVRNKCRRLGRPQADKIQPLLIRLNNADAAAGLLKATKQLRRLDNETVSRYVFINPDLTIGQAQVAFERRQMRRQRIQRHHVTDDSAVVVGRHDANTQPGTDVPQRSRADNYDTHGHGHDPSETDDDENGVTRQTPVNSRLLSADAAPFTLEGRVPSVS